MARVLSQSLRSAGGTGPEPGLEDGTRLSLLRDLLGAWHTSCLKNCLCSEGPEVECVHLGEVKQGEDEVLHGSIWELEENANWLLMLSPSAKSRWL